MSKFPRFNSTDPDEVHGDGDAGHADGGDFRSLLKPDCRTGDERSKALPIPETPAGMTATPPRTEEEALRAIAAARVGSDEVPANVAFRDTREPRMDWLQQAEVIARKSTPRGRWGVERQEPGLYGNLSETRWPVGERVNQSHAASTEPAATPAGNNGPAPLPDVAAREELTPEMVQAAQAQLRQLLAGNAPRANDEAEPGDDGAASEGWMDRPVDTETQSWSGRFGRRTAAVLGDEPSLFGSFYHAEPLAQKSPRIPHAGHLLLLAVLAFFGTLGTGLLRDAALHYHMWGVSTVEKSMTDIHYTIGSMAALYLITFGAAIVILPLLWGKSFFDGLQWNARGALRRFRQLAAAACMCFLLAMVDEVLLPGPTNAPIDKLFDNRTAAWALLIFGITFAPFFEEIIFRGFLLPALCTAFDWSVERATGMPASPLNADGHPDWSVGAMIFASIATSVPFAWMHAEQTGYSIGPFVLLVAVSLVLCWARLRARALAASVLVHASYNFLLFALMLWGTQGFRHLDKM